MKPPKRDPLTQRGRDEQPSEFTHILERLVELEPAILAAVLVDSEGETVDYAGVLAPFDAKLAAAHLRIILNQLSGFVHVASPPRIRAMHGGIPRSMAPAPVRQVLVRGVRRSFLMLHLADGYALVAVLKRQRFGVSARALAIAERALAAEAGWPAPEQKGPTWYPVRVESDAPNRRRPHRMLTGSTWQHIEVLGSLVGLGRDRGYRCRLRSGAEVTLVREPAGVWYADEEPDSWVPR